MQNICAKIKSFLKKYNLDNKDLIYLVGFSGGYDSMCLLSALKKATPKNKIIALHLNHKWRGEESDREELNCKEFCKSIGTDFYTENLPINIPHTETAARDARYKFFENCAKKFQSNIVFTAHNANDNAETLIYRICKGTGVSGLQGIAEKRDIFYRPLLSVKRESIEKYCAENKLSPNSDSSNKDKKYKRNYIRAEILPMLKNVSPYVTDMINSLSEIARDETQIVEEYMEYIYEKIKKDGEIQTQKFIKLTPAVQNRLIYNMFLHNNLEYDRKKISNIIDFINENSNSKSGKTCSLNDNLWLFTSNKIIKIITKNSATMPYFHITKEGKYISDSYTFEIEKFEKNVRKFPKDSDGIAYVDLSKYEFDFELRTRNDGDIIRPYGTKGSQKLKKYLNAKKIPNHEKENLMFLAQHNEILWAVNLGINDKIKVVKNPTHRLKFYKNEREQNGN